MVPNNEAKAKRSGDGNQEAGARKKNPQRRTATGGRYDRDTGKGGKEGVEVRSQNLQPRAAIGEAEGEDRNREGGYRRGKGKRQHRDREAENGWRFSNEKGGGAWTGQMDEDGYWGTTRGRANGKREWEYK